MPETVPAIMENAVVEPALVPPATPAPMEQISSAELADLRRRAEKYRFLFRTIVTVTTIVAVALLAVVIVAIGFD
jgi:hypothetical protein